MIKSAIDEVFQSLNPCFGGDLLRPGNEEYNDARKVWNGMVARNPGLIARCNDVQDIQAAVRAARSAGVLTAVRCGGHSLAGHSTCEGGLVIDLSRLRRVSVDEQRRRARFDGGCLLGTVDQATQRANLVFPAGVVSETGVAGLTLGGGYGWLTRRFGLSCDNVEGFTLVLADGSVERASVNENTDLFWALRGGGGNFGIVTEFKVRLHCLSSVLFGTAKYWGDALSGILDHWRELMPHVPDELKWSFSLQLGIRRPGSPEPVASSSLAWIGNAGDAQPHFDEALSGFGATAVTRQEMPFLALQTMADWEFPSGRRYYTKSGYLKSLDDRCIRCMIDALATMPSPASQIEVSYQGGAAARVGAQETAFGARSSPFIINILGSWSDQSDDAANVAWAKKLFAELQPFMAPGAYVNFMSSDEQQRVAEAYHERWDRLVTVKTRYDPTNFFRLNPNIPPAGMPARLQP